MAPLDEVRQARQALYEAVVTLPFDLSAPLPDGDAVGVFVDECREWHNRGVSAFNGAKIACYSSIVADAEPRDAVPLTAFTGEPRFGDTSAARSPAQLHFAQSSMASFENRVKTEDERMETWFLQTVPNAKPGTGPGSDPAHQARRLVLDLRRRALDFIDWLDTAIVRLETAFLPRDVEMDEGEGKYNRWIIRMEYAGTQQNREIGEAIGKQLKALLSAKRYVDFNDSKALDRFEEALPEIAPHLKALRGGPRGKPRRGLTDTAFAAMRPTSP